MKTLKQIQLENDVYDLREKNRELLGQNRYLKAKLSEASKLLGLYKSRLQAAEDRIYSYEGQMDVKDPVFDPWGSVR
jgi:SMC interacting uncharacterized protein involved in chromosome segregation